MDTLIAEDLIAFEDSFDVITLKELREMGEPTSCEQCKAMHIVCYLDTDECHCYILS